MAGKSEVSFNATASPAPQPATKLNTPPASTPAQATPQGAVPIGGTSQYVAPTDNLTQIANSLRLQTKSLTTLITLPAGLSVNQSVEVSIGYFSSTAASQRITQSYVRSTGNRFLYNDPEKDGKPRHMRIDVSLREPKPDGDFYTFAFTIQTDLDPLYDVQISPLKFTLLKDCASFGDSDIAFFWYAPDRSLSERVSPRAFSTSAGKQVLINEFAWVGREVSASMENRQPYLFFYNIQQFPIPTFTPTRGASNVNLVPGKTKTFKYVLDEGTPNAQPVFLGCYADIEYTMTYTLRWYADF